MPVPSADKIRSRSSILVVADHLKKLTARAS